MRDDTALRRTQKVYWAMLYRCEVSKAPNYHRYGGRGISVCERWKSSFDNFRADMGLQPAKLFLDREDNDGNYEPGNCRWVDRKTSDRNKSKNIRLTFCGQTKVLSDWADEFGLSKATIGARIKAGWTIEAALTTPTVGQISRKERDVPILRRLAEAERRAEEAKADLDREREKNKLLIQLLQGRVAA